MSDDWDSDLAVTSQQLASQLAYFAERGYSGVTFAEAEAARARGGSDGKQVVVTFDDGFRSVLKARPLLDTLGFTATVFVVTQFVSSPDPFVWQGMEPWLSTPQLDELRSLTWEDCVDLRAGGWEIGSHTVTHPALPSIDDERCLAELTRSRHEIEERLGSCTSVAYPYGRANRRIAAIAKTAGYAAGCTLTFAQRPDEPLLRPRIGLVRSDDTRRVALKLSPAVRFARRTILADAIQRLGIPGSTRQPYLDRP